MSDNFLTLSVLAKTLNGFSPRHKLRQNFKFQSSTESETLTMSSKKLRVCVVTGTRAEYGHMQWLIHDIHQHPSLELQLVVTGTHLAPEFGMTVNEIIEQGFPIADRIEMLVSGDTPVATGQSMALATIGFVNSFNRLKPDVVVMLGDRYELLACAQACLVSCIPIAHIAGGDTTEGAFDEAIRHAITKMAHLHFTTNSVSQRRVIQMGENPQYVFNVGVPSLDHLKRIKLLDRKQWQESLQYSPKAKNVLVTFHPVTLEPGQSEIQMNELFKALDLLGEEVGIIFTKSNADTDGRKLNLLIDTYASSRSHVKTYSSLGHTRYLSTLQFVDVVIGNSSSGIYEVPVFKKPTVNIGDRQKGRLAATSVLNCNPVSEEIVSTIRSAFKMDCGNTSNPYGGGDSTEQMLKILLGISDFKSLVKKHFHMLEFKI